jgi:serine/threonine protein phosphatase PrpC
MNQFTCVSEVRTHVGNVRSHNEDAAAARDTDGLWVVADGMGGHQAGDYASSVIVSSISKLSLRAYLVDVVEQVEDNLAAVNNELIGYANDAFASASKVGSTVACLIVRYGVAVAMWSGDSRIYLWRDNKLLLMTRDHTKVQELMDQGHLTPEQAEQSNLKNMLTRAVGVHEEFFLDINAFSIRHGDRFLICSDGLYNEVDDGAIGRAIQAKKIKKVADNLLTQTLAGEARDNVTLIVVEVI